MIHSMIENSEWRWVLIGSILLLLTISLPFIWAYAAAIPDLHFVGVLVNPADGVFLLSTMAQGYQGDWLFHIPYAVEAHDGVFAFSSYILIGHISRILNLPTVQVFHVARLTGSILMFLVIYRFMADWTDDVNQRRIAWSLAVAGSGFGWLALLLGRITPDVLLQPEAFPLQAAYTNVHFPWSIAAGIWIAHVLLHESVVHEDSIPGLDLTTISLALASVFLSMTFAFMLLPIAIGFASMLVRRWQQQHIFPRREFNWGAVVLIFSVPMLAYNVWAFSDANPIIGDWVRNVSTSSPPVWDYMIAFGPMLILGLLGMWASRNLLQDADFFLLSWLAAIVVLAYIPVYWQRRVLIGFSVPLAVYVGRALWRVVTPDLTPRMRTIAIVFAYWLFVPTTILAIVLPLVGTLDETGRYPYYLTDNEWDAMTWIADDAGDDAAIVIASPELGLYLPLFGQKVVGGYGYEVIRSDSTQHSLIDFFAGEDCSVVLEQYSVDYVIVGPRERSYMPDDTLACLPDVDAVFSDSAGDVMVFAVP